MDEEGRQRNLGEEAKKECELTQLQIDQLEADVDATVQEYIVFSKVCTRFAWFISVDKYLLRINAF